VRARETTPVTDRTPVLAKLTKRPTSRPRSLWRRPIAGALTASLLLFGLATTGAALTLPLSRLGVPAPYEGTLAITRLRAVSENRIRLDAIVSLPRAMAILDAEGRARGNLGSWNDRLYWIGPTSTVDQRAGDVLHLRTRLRYERWERGTLLGQRFEERILQDTRGVTLAVRPRWNPQAQTLSLRYDVAAVDGLPSEGLRLLRDLGVQLEGASTLPVANAPLLQALALRVERAAIRPTRDGGGLAVDLMVSADRSAALGQLGLAGDLSGPLGRGLTQTLLRLFSRQ